MAEVTCSQVLLQGIVCCVPGAPLHAEDLCPTEEIKQRAQQMGLERLFRAAPGQTTADLCTAAARHLLRKLDWAAEGVDGVIVVTQTPDYFLPNTASVVHAALGLPQTCFAFDVAMGCSGFIYGLWMASQFLGKGSVKRVLLLVGDTLSKLAEPEDALVGDAAAAIALQWSSEAQPASFVLMSDGKGVPNLIAPGGAFRDPARGGGDGPAGAGASGVRGGLHMNGWELFKFAVSEVPGLVNRTLALHGWAKEEVDLFLIHQANQVVLQHIAHACGLPPEKVPVHVGRYGNTSGVSLPLLMADAVRAQLATGPQRLLLAAFGVGYAWAAAALTAGPLAVADVINI